MRARDRAVPLQEEQEGEDLHGLPEPHVVGEAAAEAEPGEVPEPADALALVGSERRPERLARIGPGLAARAAEIGEGLREPRSGLDAGPLALRVGLGSSLREVGAREEPHRLDEREAVLGVPLRLLPAAEHLVELLPVHLDPAPLQEDEPLGPLAQLRELGLGELLVAEGEADGEVEHCVEAERGGLLLSHRDRDARSRGAAAAPPVGDADHDAAVLERGHLAEEAVRLDGRPGLRLEEPARVGERLHEGAPLRGALDGLEEREESPAIGGRGGLADGVAERAVLRLPARGETGGVGGEEGEGLLGIAPVLGEVEVHASDDAPGPILGREPRLDRAGRGRELGAPGFEDVMPERPEDVGREVLPAGDRRGAGGEPLELTLARRGIGMLAPLLEVGERAERRDEGAAEVPPEGEDRRERRSRLGGAEVEEAGGVTALEGFADPPRRRRFRRGLVRLGRAKEDVAGRREGDREGVGHRGRGS